MSILPLCETARGCPIENCARNEKSEELITGFFDAKILSTVTKSSVIYEQRLKELGLFDRPDLLMTLEIAFIEYQQHKNNAQLVRQKNGY